jgi:CRISPR-associated protein Cas1
VALLAITQSDARLAMQGTAFVVLLGDQVARKVPVHRVSEVHLYGDVELSAAARRVLLDEGIEVLFLKPRGGYRGRLLGPLTRQGDRRVAQYRALTCPDRAQSLARSVVTAKLHNQRQLLLRLGRHHQHESIAGATVGLRRLLNTLAEAKDVDVIRGIEGHGAALYFRGLGAALTHPEIRFERRNRRPPRDPFNACLSFGYTLLLGRVESAVHRAGLDLYVGALHLPSRGQPSMALDLMEPLRPVMVDRVVARLINRRQLCAADFENPDVDPGLLAAPEEPEDPEVAKLPAVYLGPSGRTIFLQALYAEWRKPVFYPARDARFPLDEVLSMDALACAKHLEDPDTAFTPFMWTG